MESKRRAGKRVGIWIGAGLAIAALLIVLVLVVTIDVRLLGPYDYPGSTWVSDSPQLTLHVSPDSNHSPYIDSEAYITLDGEEIPVLIMIESGKTVVIARRPASSVDDNLLYGRLRKMTSKEVVIEVMEGDVFSGQYETITLKRVG